MRLPTPSTSPSAAQSLLGRFAFTRRISTTVTPYIPNILSSASTTSLASLASPATAALQSHQQGHRRQMSVPALAALTDEVAGSPGSASTASTASTASSASTRATTPGAWPAAAAAEPADGLLAQLAKERRRVAAAEAKLDSMATEVEELSQNLFEEANEMVARERREHAKTEGRLRESRAREERLVARLNTLEDALSRIMRLRRDLPADNTAAAVIRRAAEEVLAVKKDLEAARPP
ncbi:uncharacterized protein V1510DRAFT_423933 [Dipodascopsis tothii]|uniref:uncharacterized protein n=1 Tax=Dipodascopsis tothii TaxID=44089 RepID=UPI0034CF4D71